VPALLARKIAVAEKEKTEKFSVLPREARQSVGVLFKMIFFQQTPSIATFAVLERIALRLRRSAESLGTARDKPPLRQAKSGIFC
jgi:hypothetical protein